MCGCAAFKSTFERATIHIESAQDLEVDDQNDPAQGVETTEELKLVKGQYLSGHSDNKDVTIDALARLKSKLMREHRVKGDWTQNGNYTSNILVP